MVEDIAELNKKAVEVVLSFPRSTRVRVVSHYDADGITAAGVLCTALYRKGYDFHATLMRNPFTKGFDRLAKQGNKLVIFSDMGSGQIEMMKKLGCPCIIFDHHQYYTEKPGSDILQINANLCGIDGNYEASGATLAYSFACALDPANEDLCSLALAGAIGDKQHIGGIRGFNKQILDIALEKKYLTERVGIKLYGDSVSDALRFSIDPYYPGLSGNKEEIQRVLSKLDIKEEALLNELDETRKIRLQSYLLFHLIRAGCQQGVLDIAIRTRYYSEVLGCELERFADLLDACGKNQYRSLGLSLCLGGVSLFPEAVQVEKDYKQKILDALQVLEGDGVHETPGMRFFYSERSSLGGVIAGIAVNYLLDEEKPLFSIARKDDEIHVSARGNQRLVKRGLDLGGALKQVSSELDGHGGGHKIAAGATLAVEKEQEFLEELDKVLVSQMKGAT